MSPQEKSRGRGVSLKSTSIYQGSPRPPGEQANGCFRLGQARYEVRRAYGRRSVLSLRSSRGRGRDAKWLGNGPDHNGTERRHMEAAWLHGPPPLTTPHGHSLCWPSGATRQARPHPPSGDPCTRLSRFPVLPSNSHSSRASSFTSGQPPRGHLPHDPAPSLPVPYSGLAQPHSSGEPQHGNDSQVLPRPDLSPTSNDTLNRLPWPPPLNLVLSLNPPSCSNQKVNNCD